ncbi:MAG: ABC transporter substrate-binding protein, partial [Proteobacteria bacterium]|nr:ABC transporter substrate-binding protein [Pseudomonadota bacterium]
MSLPRRRMVLGGASTMVAMAPRGAGAQAPRRPARIGWITAQQPASLTPYLQAMRAGLAEQGYVEGHNISIEYRYGNDDLTTVPSLARDLTKLPVDLIVSQGAATWELVKLDLPLPLVYLISADPVSAGFAESLAHPTGNKTGLTLMLFEFAAKRLELLREMVPNLHKVAVVGNPEHAGSALERASSENKARDLKIAVDYLPTSTRAALGTAFETIDREKPQAVSLLADG